MSKEQLQYFDVWIEGYNVTGNSSDASFLGRARATSFKQACEMVVNTVGMADSYDPDKNTVWGCRLFDNEPDARKAFG